MDATQIGELIIGAVVVILGYFLKIIHGDIKQNTKDVGMNAGQIDKLSSEIEHERELRQQSYGNIMTILTEIKDDIKNLKK